MMLLDRFRNYQNNNSIAFFVNTLILLGCIFFIIRLFFLSSFMTHVDDIVPLFTLIGRRFNPLNPLQIVELSQGYTYPPGQFFISFPLTKLSTGYYSLLFWMRLPSLIFWASGICMSFVIIRDLLVELFPDDLNCRESATSAAAVVSVLAALCWRGLIESSQGYNYALTLPVAAALCWIFLSSKGHRWLFRNTWLNPFLGGLVVGATFWLTYQAAYFLVPLMLTIFLCTILEQRNGWIKQFLVFGLGAAILPALTYPLFLRVVLTSAKTIPAWAGSSERLRVPEIPGYIFDTWYGVIQNVSTFLAWGYGSKSIADILIFAMLLGAMRLISLAFISLNQRRTAVLLRVITFILIFFVFFSVIGVARLFPLGVTRHSYILQFPILLTCALGLYRLGISFRSATVTISVMVLIFAFNISQLRRNTIGKENIPLIQKLLAENPKAILVDDPSGFTWNVYLLAYHNPALLNRLRINANFTEDSQIAALMAADGVGIIVSHRGPISPSLVKAFDQVAMNVTALQSDPPNLGPELSGNINGGNGYFVYLIKKREEAAK